MAKRQKDILNEEQKNFLAFAATEPYLRENYYLTGGTPLTAFYLQHRYSEDLDFFIEAEEVNILAVQKLMARAKKKFRLTKITYQVHYGLHMFFLTFPNGKDLYITSQKFIKIFI